MKLKPFARSKTKGTLKQIGGTSYELFISSSMGYGEEFTIGNVRFRNEHSRITALDPIPESWFVDLSEGVEDGSDLT
jgi:hypothetical protein